ncbi:BRCT domain-containing protein (plasmid) [Microbulbifer sp. DLAB2-AF]|uniref:BRCT domain-containing protein n=1 Tax=Microbulbifer sp. DLAB2-AF TaxID=3243395 RepID=UPI00403A4A44
MDVFTRFNRKHLQDRQIDTLIGLSKGITADGQINQSEAEFLKGWLYQNSETKNPIILNLLEKVSGMLADGVLDSDESAELFTTLQAFTGETSVDGEVPKSSTLPVCTPPPHIQFTGKTFLFTGTCAYGSRKECQKVIEALGGVSASRVTKSLDYLVLGTYVSDSWIHESFGRKIEKAIEYRDSGLPLTIVTEEHWANEANL